MKNNIPKGCYCKSILSKALNMGTNTLQAMAKEHDFPKPAGYYQCSNRRKYPYWNLEEVKCYLDGVTYEPVKPCLKNRKPHAEDEKPWVVPAHDRGQQSKCIEFRNFYHLMKGASCQA